MYFAEVSSKPNQTVRTFLSSHVFQPKSPDPANRRLSLALHSLHRATTVLVRVPCHTHLEWLIKAGEHTGLCLTSRQ